MSTYEAARDLIRAQNLPWYRDYLHPSLEEYYKPSMTRHGTFWTGWTERPGSAVAEELSGVDGRRARVRPARAASSRPATTPAILYGSLYGFGISRELELHHEAGFHPLEVLQARDHRTARRCSACRTGSDASAPASSADLLVINGNPLENLRLMNPYGTDLMSVNGQIIDNYSRGGEAGRSERAKSVHGGGIEWTIKDGIPYARADPGQRGERPRRQGPRRA